MAWVLDLDGVMWLAADPIPGAADAVARLRERGETVVFVTNNSNGTLEENEEKLAGHGVDAEGAVVTSALAVAELVEPGERVLLCAGPGVREAVTNRGAVPAEDGQIDAVVVGYHADFHYDRMRKATAAIFGGARLLASNDDATYPTPNGPIPGAGAILAGIEKASGTTATVAGKPYEAMAELVKRKAGDEGIVVGDRPDTDGRFAQVLGYKFALVFSGVTGEDDLHVDPEPDVVAPDLATLVDKLLD